MPSRRAVIATLVVAGVGAACRGAPGPAARSPLPLDEVAERYVRLTLKLAQHQPSLVEAWLGPQEWRPGPREPVAEIRDEIQTAHAALASLSPPAGQVDRYRYLQGQLRALEFAARRLAGESMRFWDEARAALGVEEIYERSAGTRVALDRLLPGRGPLHRRYAAFRVRHALSPGRIMPTFRGAMEACRDRVRRHIALPETESVELETATELALEARAVYRGEFLTRVLFDTSGKTDLARLVWLTAHETYPGHHVQHVLADGEYVRAKGWHERALHPAFGTHLLYAEGAAEAGAALLLEDGVFEDVCRALAPVAGLHTGIVADLVAVHRAVVALDAVIPAIAQGYLDGEIGGEAAAERLTIEALVADAQEFLRVIERQRTRLLAYALGRRLVGAELLSVPADLRWPRLKAIATTLNRPA